MMEPADDSYYTIAAPAEAIYKDKGSKFLAYAWPVTDERQIRDALDGLRKRYYDATHHCYAWRLGPEGENVRMNDDGEPSSTAGRPILGQLLSRQVTDALVVVVRYFGGTKLGVPGLIAAYKESAAAVLDAAEVVQRTVNTVLRIGFGYLAMNAREFLQTDVVVAMNDVMRIVKEMQPEVLGQQFDNACTMTLSIRRSRSQQLLERLRNVESMSIDLK